MKILNNISKWLVLPAMAAMTFPMVSCEDQPDQFELTGGVPTIDYVRLTDVESADSLITGAYMSTSICLVGHNLTSIREMYFNDRQAVLNTSYITDRTLIVNVPSTIPEEVTDQIIMHTADGRTVTYPFQTLVPAPTITTMNNEYLEPGKAGTIIGNYFVNNDEVPLTLSISGEEIRIEDYDQYNIYFTMPPDKDIPEGTITVTTRYGTSVSKFHYKESRNMLFDNWGQEGEDGTGLTHNGWSTPKYYNDEYSIDGWYLQLGDGSAEVDESATATWPQNDFQFDYHAGSWDTPEVFDGSTESSAIRLSSLFNVSDWQNMALKFELYVPSGNPWSSGALQILFSADEQITVGTQNNMWWRDMSDDAASGGYALAGENYGRALYRPWTSTADGSYDTGGEWVTVSIPLDTSFAYYLDGSSASKGLDENHFSGLTMMLYSGGVSGTACRPILKIDNVRVIPYK